MATLFPGQPYKNQNLKKKGEPVRKEKKEDLEANNAPKRESLRQGENKSPQKLTRKEEKTRREERKVAREVRRKKTKENRLNREKKAKMAKEKLENEGLRRTKNQLVLRDWLKGGSMKLPKQGETRGAKKKGPPKKGIG